MNNVEAPSQTIARQLENIKLPETLNPANIQQNLSEGIQTVSSNIESVKQNIGNTLNEFSSKNVVDASTDFLESNSLIAKFAFLVLVLIVFMFLLNLGIMLIGYFTQPSNNPYIVKGTINGNEAATISQNPKTTDSIIIKRSNNESKGIELTWSMWLLISQIPKDANYQHIFSKGDLTKNTAGIYTINGPGVYLVKDSSDPKKANLKIIMDTVVSETPGKSDLVPNTYVDVKNIPLNKWVNVTFRVENKIMDVYVNGTISNRLVFDNVPLQNYHDIQICKDGGFSGKISNLRYFSYSLNIFEINTLVLGGPDLKPGQISSNINKVSDPTFSYISNMWYIPNRAAL
jgi:hypothetical protein